MIRNQPTNNVNHCFLFLQDTLKFLNELLQIGVQVSKLVLCLVAGSDVYGTVYLPVW